MLAFLDHVVTQGFLSEKHRAMVLVEREPKLLLERLSQRVSQQVTRKAVSGMLKETPSVRGADRR